MEQAAPIHPTSGLRRITSAFNGRLLFSCGLLALSQINFGMDLKAFATTQAMPFFVQKFGTRNASTGSYAFEPYFLSLLNSLNYIGFAFGLVSGSFISRRFGRRVSLFTMCIWAIAAAIIILTAERREQILAGRVIAYIYIGMELAVIPVLQSELVPKHVRGFVVGTYQSGILVGSLIMAVVCRGTSDIQGHDSWRIPFGLFFIVPTIVACGVWFTDESPRWLLLKGRREDAYQCLIRLRKGAFSDEEIEKEFQDLEAITSSALVEKGVLLRCSEAVTNLKRTLVSVGVNLFLQLTGNTFVTIYGAVFMSGLKGVNAFTMTTINTAVNAVMTLLSQFLTDRVGRRPLLLIGAVIQTAALFTMGSLGTITNPGYPIRVAIAAMTTIFGVGFCLGWAPISHIVAAEIPSSRLRDFVISFCIPFLLYAPYANLGSKVGFIFGSFALLAIIFSYFSVPECKGKSLEEIDELFAQGVPLRKFGDTTTTRADIETDIKEKL
uniref:Major facilitator superfamily (MFS) profile domain-containing protein n=1 Tax=Bionectria ochroleuca TaxID=29856 RepID=A0A8H7TWM9_BIOOC